MEGEGEGSREHDSGAVGMSDSAMGAGDRPPKGVRALREHGPAPLGSLPVSSVNIRARIWGARKFGPKKNSSNSGGVGTLRHVWYLEGTHSKTDVVRAWFDANPRFVEAASEHQAKGFLLGSYGDAWERPIRHVLDEVYGEGSP